MCDKLDRDKKGGFNRKFLNLKTKHYVIPAKSTLKVTKNLKGLSLNLVLFKSH